MVLRLLFGKGKARVVQVVQGAARRYWSNKVSKGMTNEANTELRFTH
jgi:hypothetical protein